MSTLPTEPVSTLYAEGVQVRLKAEPQRVGICTGRVREKGGVWMVQVLFGHPTWYADCDLDLVGAPPPADDEAIRTGRFARAADLRRRLTHIQLSGRLADLVYSMNTTNTDFYAHQYKPVLSFLQSPSRGLLIADEVGLGKTIEAGLIWTELRARVDARRLLVICPKMLCDKWQLELRNRFGVEASIVDAADLAAELKRPRPQFPASQAMIASMQVEGNQLRLYFSALAYTLMEALRRLGLEGTEWAQAQVDTIRLKLFKIGAILRISVRRITLQLNSAYPWKNIFAQAFHALRC